MVLRSTFWLNRSKFIQICCYKVKTLVFLCQNWSKFWFSRSIFVQILVFRSKFIKMYPNVVVLRSKLWFWGQNWSKFWSTGQNLSNFVVMRSKLVNILVKQVNVCLNFGFKVKLDQNVSKCCCLKVKTLVLRSKLVKMLVIRSKLINIWLFLGHSTRVFFGVKMLIEQVKVNSGCGGGVLVSSSIWSMVIGCNCWTKWPLPGGRFNVVIDRCVLTMATKKVHFLVGPSFQWVVGVVPHLSSSSLLSLLVIVIRLFTFLLRLLENIFPFFLLFLLVFGRCCSCGWPLSYCRPGCGNTWHTCNGPDYPSISNSMQFHRKKFIEYSRKVQWWYYAIKWYNSKWNSILEIINHKSIVIHSKSARFWSFFTCKSNFWQKLTWKTIILTNFDLKTKILT